MEVEVVYNRARQPQKPNGAGNHFNFIPLHDCRGKAMQRVEMNQAELAKLIGTTKSHFRKTWLEIKKNQCIYGDEARAQAARTVRLCLKSSFLCETKKAQLEAVIESDVTLATAYADWSTKLSS